MRGRMAARRGAYELATFTAWQAERFARSEKLQPLRHYLKSSAKRPQGPPTPAERLAMHKARAAAGVPVKITRIG